MNKLKENVKSKHSEKSTGRSAARDELDFSNDKPTPSFIDLEPENELSEIVQDNQRSKSTKIAMPGDDPTDDDLAAEVLIKEDGARSSHERGNGKAMDQRLSIVDEDEIGAGYGLDEAELARVKPLDGKREKTR